MTRPRPQNKPQFRKDIPKANFRLTVEARLGARERPYEEEAFIGIVKQALTDGTVYAGATLESLAEDIKHLWVHHGNEIRLLDWEEMAKDYFNEDSD